MVARNHVRQILRERRRMIAILAALMLGGCAAPGVRVEVEHVSHPTDGWPFGPQRQENTLTTVGAVASWQRGRAYLDAGLGVNTGGRNGGGFYGSPVTGSIRAGYVLREAK